MFCLVKLIEYYVTCVSLCNKLYVTMLQLYFVALHLLHMCCYVTCYVIYVSYVMFHSLSYIRYMLLHCASLVTLCYKCNKCYVLFQMLRYSTYVMLCKVILVLHCYNILHTSYYMCYCYKCFELFHLLGQGASCRRPVLQSYVYCKVYVNATNNIYKKNMINTK